MYITEALAEIKKTSLMLDSNTEKKGANKSSFFTL